METEEEGDVRSCPLCQLIFPVGYPDDALIKHIDSHLENSKIWHTQPRHDLLLVHSYIHSLLLVFLAGCLQTECRRRCTCGQSPNLISETEIWDYLQNSNVSWMAYISIYCFFSTQISWKIVTFYFKHCYQLHTLNQTDWAYCNVKARISAFNYSSHYYLHYLHFNVVTECVLWPFFGELSSYEGAIQDEYEGILDNGQRLHHLNFSTLYKHLILLTLRQKSKTL